MVWCDKLKATETGESHWTVESARVRSLHLDSDGSCLALRSCALVDPMEMFVVHHGGQCRTAVPYKSCRTSCAAESYRQATASPISKKTGSFGSLSIFSHLLLALRLFWSKGRKRSSRSSKANLRPRVFPWRFRQDLRNKGVGVVQIPLATIEPLQRIAKEYLTKEFPEFSPTWKPTRPTPQAIELGSFVRADGLNAAFPSTMSWHWASDAATLQVFAEPGQYILRSLGDDFALVAASLVVASGDCLENVSKFHLDFGPPKIPRGVAATALMPLWPDRFPDEGNLVP